MTRGRSVRREEVLSAGEEELRLMVEQRRRTDLPQSLTAYLFQSDGEKTDETPEAPASPISTNDYNVIPDQIVSAIRYNDYSTLLKFGTEKCSRSFIYVRERSIMFVYVYSFMFVYVRSFMFVYVRLFIRVIRISRSRSGEKKFFGEKKTRTGEWFLPSNTLRISEQADVADAGSSSGCCGR
ncbi:hypothetical protein LXL04_017970 [Taraxacum kok-saghyz]